jgi:hypothetical protein
MLSPSTKVHPATKRIEEYDLIDPSGRWLRFRRITRAEIWENRIITTVAIVVSAAIWVMLFLGLWRHFAHLLAQLSL